MKKLLAVLFLCCAAFPALAQDMPLRVYLSGDYALTQSKIDLGGGFELKENSQSLYGASLGLAFSERWRVEASYQKRTNMKDSWDGVAYTTMGNYDVSISGKVESQAALINAYYDLYAAERLKVFVGAGAGAMFWDASWDLTVGGVPSSGSTTETDPVVALYAGITLVSSENENFHLDLGLAYYHVFMKSGDDYISKKDVNNIAPKVSVRYYF